MHRRISEKKNLRYIEAFLKKNLSCINGITTKIDMHRGISRKKKERKKIRDASEHFRKKSQMYQSLSKNLRCIMAFPKKNPRCIRAFLKKFNIHRGILLDCYCSTTAQSHSDARAFGPTFANAGTAIASKHWEDRPLWHARARHKCGTQLGPVVPGTDTEKPGGYRWWVPRRRRSWPRSVQEEAAAEWHNEGTTPL